MVEKNSFMAAKLLHFTAYMISYDLKKNNTDFAQRDGEYIGEGWMMQDSDYITKTGNDSL